MAEEQHLRRIILGLFNPTPDHHLKGCLANERGPCICGYSQVAGEYLWALREAKKIAAEHYDTKEVETASRLREPPALVEAAAQRLCLPNLHKRRPFEESRPDGMMESDRDFLENNREAAVKLLEAAIAAT